MLLRQSKLQIIWYFVLICQALNHYAETILDLMCFGLFGKESLLTKLSANAFEIDIEEAVTLCYCTFYIF